MTILEKVRSMKTNEKNKIALLSAGLLTAIIVGVWFLALRDPKIDSTVKENSTAESLKPLFMIFKSAKEEIKDIRSDARANKQKSDEIKSLSQ